MYIFQGFYVYFSRFFAMFYLRYSFLFQYFLYIFANCVYMFFFAVNNMWHNLVICDITCEILQLKYYKWFEILFCFIFVTCNFILFLATPNFTSKQHCVTQEDRSLNQRCLKGADMVYFWGKLKEVQFIWYIFWGGSWRN